MSKEKYPAAQHVDPAFFDGPQKQKFSTFVYNRREGTILGRNTESWSKIKPFD